MDTVRKSKCTCAFMRHFKFNIIFVEEDIRIGVGLLSKKPINISNISSTSSVGPKISFASLNELDFFHCGSDEQAFDTGNMRSTPSREESGQSSEDKSISALDGCLGAEASTITADDISRKFNSTILF